MVTGPSGSVVVTVRITLRPGRDDDLIELVRNAAPRRLAACIRDAMRSGVVRETDEDEDDFELPDIGEEI